MRLNRIIMALTIGLAVAAVPTVAAAAQPQPAPTVTTPPADYPPQPPALTVNPTSLTLGASAQLTGWGFGPNETVDITIRVNPVLPPLVATTDGDGWFTISHTPHLHGTHTYTATGRVSGRTASVTLEVLPKPQPSPSRSTSPSPKPPHKGGWLPVTGDDAGTPLKVGGALVGVGAVLMLLTLAWRRNRLGAGSGS
ncbi:hypothetical protein AWW66_29425 [Micromonospora rosaria]|uniref:Gram-positive cocci surface proteins LPxTG domain-containing protein n=1 Tax=Micromonospora rosaria TaxID=47874 RepID=A0A136PJC2_9ACTN|nr:hypothetical protein [Micromonospora rosaria]KXK58498.1 hypothetical protein AWW66_29425 [Micromonospora rosaria]